MSSLARRVSGNTPFRKRKDGPGVARLEREDACAVEAAEAAEERGKEAHDPAPRAQEGQLGKRRALHSRARHQDSMLICTPTAACTEAGSRRRSRSRGRAQAGRHGCHSQQSAARRRERGKKVSRQCQPARGQPWCRSHWRTNSRTGPASIKRRRKA